MSGLFQRFFHFFLARPWWINAGLGVLFYVLFSDLVGLLAGRGGPFGVAAAGVFGVLPGAVLVIFLFLAIASVIERRRGKSREPESDRGPAGPRT